MKLKHLVVSAGVVGSVFALRGGCANSTAPDEELADHFAELCEIASDNVDTPEKGVKKLGRYMGRHLDDILGDFGSTLVAIERIENDKKHDERARLARDRMQQPWIACQRDWMRFWEAVDQDQAATEIVTRAADRISRTMDIIFSSKDYDLRGLPERILKRFD